MGGIDRDFDLRLSRLAGADFLKLSASSEVKFAEVQKARYRLDQAEGWKAQIMTKIEQLEHIVKRRFEVNE